MAEKKSKYPKMAKGKPSPEVAPSSPPKNDEGYSSWDMERYHEKEAEKHETVASYHAGRGKTRLAGLHRQAAEKHLLASMAYRKVSGVSSRAHQDNAMDRAQERNQHVHEFVDMQGLDLGDGEPEGENLKKARGGKD